MSSVECRKNHFDIIALTEVNAERGASILENHRLEAQVEKKRVKAEVFQFFAPTHFHYEVPPAQMINERKPNNSPQVLYQATLPVETAENYERA
ncbi:unnamed protein product [Ceratitis capitata]|uniref:(Mediterranean fruit fly) hypothetical protein n=1 Tax=Ceratitis capitata TaxID=7213 RepID=A0A811V534_CERCA|nr:unnamed protein product [Ceratitis capitata]